MKSLRFSRNAGTAINTLEARCSQSTHTPLVRGFFCPEAPLPRPGGNAGRASLKNAVMRTASRMARLALGRSEFFTHPTLFLQLSVKNQWPTVLGVKIANYIYITSYSPPGQDVQKTRPNQRHHEPIKRFCRRGLQSPHVLTKPENVIDCGTHYATAANKVFAPLAGSGTTLDRLTMWQDIERVPPSCERRNESPYCLHPSRLPHTS
jgi:hypothetical protein